MKKITTDFNQKLLQPFLIAIKINFLSSFSIPNSSLSTITNFYIFIHFQFILKKRQKKKFYLKKFIMMSNIFHYSTFRYLKVSVSQSTKRKMSKSGGKFNGKTFLFFILAVILPFHLPLFFVRDSPCYF